jgi:hypothetical protein
LYEACLLDFYVTQYWWISRANKYTNEQVSLYFKIVQELMDNLKGSFKEASDFDQNSDKTTCLKF